MADVGTEVPGPGHADERVEVGAVHVHLAARLVDELAHLADRLLEHAVGRRVRHHDPGEAIADRVELGPQVVDVDVAAGVGRHDDDLQAGHHGARRVRAVGARRDQAHRALLVAAGPVVGADRQQAGELALAAGVGLHAHGVVAGDLGEPRLEVGDHRAQPDGLVERGVRVEAGELGPRDRRHLGRRVELHRARPERDHRAVEREVGVGQPAQVAQHPVLGVVTPEHRLGQELVLPRGWRGHRARRRRATDRASPRTPAAPAPARRASSSRRTTGRPRRRRRGGRRRRRHGPRRRPRRRRRRRPSRCRTTSRGAA